MSAQRAVYASTRLVGTEKRGVILPDADGYYEIVVGALNVFNSAGAYYDFESAKSVFDASASLQRRIASGQLRGEYGHPKLLPGMSQRDYFNRIMAVYESEVSHHFKEIALDNTRLKDEHGKPLLAIIAKLKPCGPRGQALREQLENGSENVSFSIRSITDDEYINGILIKRLKAIVTWDYVCEPGIAYAEKYKSPSMESFEEVALTPAIIYDMQQYRKQSGMGLESFGGLNLEELIVDLGWSGSQSNLPPSARW